MEKLSQLLNYCATNPNATVRFTASDMLLAVESDASYLSVVKAHSRAAGYFYLTNVPTTPTAPLKPNGAIHVLCHIMREVLSSAAEAELACPKIGKGRAVAIRQTNTRHRQTNTTTQHNTRYELLTIRTNSNRQRHYSS
ncbi:Reverse transcriptase (RNA-dependent DNA polymerase) [Fragilaria crotonensis]|nr:Reverse transcriptase (RNA-dependent DNA polymerase) [Fragilaria crotonensis]